MRYVLAILAATAIWLLAMPGGWWTDVASSSIDGLMRFADATEASGDDLLHEIHAGAGIGCAGCHRQSPPEPDPGFTSCVACHGTMIDAASPAPAAGPDPHRSPHLGRDEMPECTSCHQVHRPSEVTCTMCHRAFRFDIR
jgi:hypothetical protein